MTPAQKQKYLDAIQTTGYPLEHSLALTLEANGWNILQNRYYLDDVTEAPREIDILAYKFNKLHDISIFTALIISCKKSEENVWTFLTRPLKHNDLNVEYRPITAFTNNKIFKHFDFKNHLKKALATDSQTEPWLSEIFEAKVQIFGFQEVHRKNFTPQNDKRIYDSISTLVKALNYEIESIPKRTTAEVIYNFHLISVFDTDGVEIKFGQSSPEVFEIKQINYLSRFLVNKTHAHHLIRFINHEAFPDVLKTYDNLHGWYLSKYKEIMEAFHKNLRTSSKCRNLYRQELKERIKPTIDWSAPGGDDGPPLVHDFEFKYLYIDARDNEDCFYAQIGTDNDSIISFLNQDAEAKNTLQEAFRELYRTNAEILYDVNNYDY